jgi:hypothetical protein
MQQLLIEPLEYRMPGRAGLDRRGFRLPLSEPAQQVRVADDADDATVTDHGDTLDAIGRQQARDFADVGFLGDRHHRRRHDLARCALGRAQVREIIGVELCPVGEERQPPIVARRFLAADQIALVDHPDWRAGPVDDWDRADLVLEQQPGDLVCRRVGADRHDLSCHYVVCIHGT